MQRRTKLMIAGAVVVTAAATGTGVALGLGGGDEDVPIEGDAYRRAASAALDHVGEGRVTDTEVGDEEGAYEVEVTRADGSQVDVHLDTDFQVIGTEADRETPDDDDGDADD